MANVVRDRASEYCFVGTVIRITIAVIFFILTSTSDVCEATQIIDASQIGLTNARECFSLDIRNDCETFRSLSNCTVIKGSLKIVLLPRSAQENSKKCDFSKIRFPLLREITDYFIFYDVKGLTTMRHMFPNLTVIRGQRLFLNYALGISNMPDLQFVEFKSLVAIQRGHVYIGSSPKLCNLNKINWDRLTLTPGENHIFTENINPCLTNPGNDCIGCNTNYCWSQYVCQKFDNDNVINPIAGIQHCNEECLGGCYNSSANGCVVCKGYTDHGTCVPQCSLDKYAMEHYKRCYTREECIEHLKMYTHGSLCVHNCPTGFRANSESMCEPCPASDDCTKVCQPDYKYGAVIIYNLADADRNAGCQVINGSLIIAIRSKVDEMQLFQSLHYIQEIRGHLKIYRSPHLQSLKFLSNLRKIQGDPVESKLYALIVYDNKNLKDLWDVKNLELSTGSMYIHSNNKLCNNKLYEFRDQVLHARENDSLQINDEEVLCDPRKLMLYTEEVTHQSLKLVWRREQTSEQVEILLRPLATNEVLQEHSELDDNVCMRVHWQRDRQLASELYGNTTHYIHKVDGLEQNRKYACFIRTFGQHFKRNGTSEVIVVTTKPDIPHPPLIELLSKTSSTLTVHLKQSHNAKDNEIITHYLLKLYDIPDETRFYDLRNYCKYPIFLPEDMPSETFAPTNINEDYEECCSQKEAAEEDRIFTENMYHSFRCSLSNKEYCTANYSGKPLQFIQLNRNETTYTLHDLTHYHMYIIEVQACNRIGCSIHSIHNERTNMSETADQLTDLYVCHSHIAGIYHVHFSEPKYPNGAITSYMIHFGVGQIDHRIVCQTRLQHERAGHKFVAHFNFTFTEAAVHVHSIAGDVMTPWLNISSCNAHNNTLTGPRSHRINIFLLCFLLGASGTLCWVCYKRRLWEKLSILGRFLPLHWSIRSLSLSTPEVTVEDRQILVDGFENVQFHNSADEESKYLDFVY